MGKSLAHACMSSGSALTTNDRRPTKKKADLAADLNVVELLLSLEIKPKRQLGYAVSADIPKRSLRVSEGSVSHVAVRVFKVWMVEEIKEICFEGDLGTFRDFEPLTHTKIHIGKVRSMKSTAPQRAIAPGTKVD